MFTVRDIHVYYSRADNIITHTHNKQATASPRTPACLEGSPRAGGLWVCQSRYVYVTLALRAQRQLPPCDPAGKAGSQGSFAIARSARSLAIRE